MLTIFLIEWTDATRNPVRGCTKMSSGRKHFSSRLSERFLGLKAIPSDRLRSASGTGEVGVSLLRWSEPKMIFGESDERFISSRCAGFIHRAGDEDDGSRHMAYLSG